MNENLQIDPSQLDEEWLQQPLLFDQAQQEAADCLERRDSIKSQQVWLESDRANYLRYAFDKEGFAKIPAQGVVDDWVTKQPEVDVCRKELQEAQMDLVRANNYVESLQMKKRALEKLCDLHISNYFSVPNPNHMLDGGKRFIESQNEKVAEKSAEATTALNEKKKERKTKKECLDSISNPETREAAESAINKEENKESTDDPMAPRARRKRR